MEGKKLPMGKVFLGLFTERLFVCYFFFNGASSLSLQRCIQYIEYMKVYSTKRENALKGTPI